MLGEIIVMETVVKEYIDYAKEMHNNNEKHWEAFASSIIDPTAHMDDIAKH